MEMHQVRYFLAAAREKLAASATVTKVRIQPVRSFTRLSCHEDAIRAKHHFGHIRPALMRVLHKSYVTLHACDKRG